MTRQVRCCCALSVLFFFLFTLISPDKALCFDTDTLKTAGIISGITIGVALVVVLVVGTVRDLKRKRGDEEDDDDVWSQSPLLRTLGYRPSDDPLFGRSSVPNEALSEEGLPGRGEIEPFPEGKIDTVRPGRLHGFSMTDTEPFRLGGTPARFSLSLPACGRERELPPFSLWRMSKDVYPNSGA